MINQHSQVVCDSTKIILEDHICLYPGYVEVTGGKITRHYSDDPNNSITPFLLNADGTSRGQNPEYKIGMLTNRKEYRRTVEEGTAPDALSDGTFHFVTLEAMDAYVKTLTEVEEVVETVVEAVFPTDEESTEFFPFPSDPVEGEVKDGLLPEEIAEATPEGSGTPPEEIVEAVSEAPPVDAPVTEVIEEKKESRVKKVIREVREKIPMNREKTMVSDPIPESSVPASFVLAEDGQNRCSVCAKRLIEVEQKEGVDAHVATHA